MPDPFGPKRPAVTNINEKIIAKIVLTRNNDHVFCKLLIALRPSSTIEGKTSKLLSRSTK